MISTVSFIELNQIIDAVHGDPHNILGMHEIEVGGKAALAVRALIPQAKRIIVLDPADQTYQCELEKIHIDGFFESVLPDRTKWFRYKYQIEGYEDNVWETYDPYSFVPQLSDLDMHLFGEGTHYEIYNKLGAHLKTLDGIDGVSFAVWAPSAVRVSVIGEFNNWDGRRGQMRKLAQSGIWEIFIPGLSAGDPYKFEIRTFEGAFIQKSDPYGFFAELRPSTTSLVYDIDQYQWKDQKWMKSRAAKQPLDGPINIYELHPGSWRFGAGEERLLNYIDLADVLIPYIKKMGYTHIELMPVTEHPFDGSWGYQPTGFFAPTSRYGAPEDFMAFVDCCHQNNIGVLLDFAASRFPKDAHGLAKFDGTPLYEPQDPRRAEHAEWGALIFDYGRKQVKNFLIASALFWIEKYHIDGLRLEALSSMLYLDYGKAEGQWVPNQYGGVENLDAVEFIKHMNSIVAAREPNVLMIAEESSAWEGVTRPVKEDGLGFSLKWNKSFINDFLAYVKQDPIYRQYHHNNLTFGLVYAYTEKYVLMLSHDELVRGKQSMLDKMPGDIWEKCANLRVAYAFLYGHPGKKLMFM
ncbi:MAG: 1,4-alpha-glucan branching protein GlgB, partial [Clostridiales bacterium]|nr:1,4-alpha-glucan branching protein GlgB [Clostridiales bacterium]